MRAKVKTFVQIGRRKPVFGDYVCPDRDMIRLGYNGVEAEHDIYQLFDSETDIPDRSEKAPDGYEFTGKLVDTKAIPPTTSYYHTAWGYGSVSNGPARDPAQRYCWELRALPKPEPKPELPDDYPKREQLVKDGVQYVVAEPQKRKATREDSHVFCDAAHNNCVMACSECGCYNCLPRWILKPEEPACPPRPAREQLVLGGVQYRIKEEKPRVPKEGDWYYSDRPIRACTDHNHNLPLWILEPEPAKQWPLPPAGLKHNGKPIRVKRDANGEPLKPEWWFHVGLVAYMAGGGWYAVYNDTEAPDDVCHGYGTSPNYQMEYIPMPPRPTVTLWFDSKRCRIPANAEPRCEFAEGELLYRMTGEVGTAYKKPPSITDPSGHEWYRWPVETDPVQPEGPKEPLYYNGDWYEATGGLEPFKDTGTPYAFQYEGKWEIGIVSQRDTKNRFLPHERYFQLRKLDMPPQPTESELPKHNGKTVEYIRDEQGRVRWACMTPASSGDRSLYLSESCTEILEYISGCSGKFGFRRWLVRVKEQSKTTEIPRPPDGLTFEGRRVRVPKDAKPYYPIKGDLVWNEYYSKTRSYGSNNGVVRPSVDWPCHIGLKGEDHNLSWPLEFIDPEPPADLKLNGRLLRRKCGADGKPLWPELRFRKGEIYAYGVGDLPKVHYWTRRTHKEDDDCGVRDLHNVTRIYRMEYAEEPQPPANGYYVFCPSRGIPKHIHPTLESATAEAKRLSDKRPGFEYQVLKIEDSFQELPF